MWACRTASPIRWTQFNGRGERPYKGKKHCLIVDYVGNAIIHGHPSSERKWTLDGDEIEESEDDKVDFKVCWSCGVNNHIDNTECHWCGMVIDDEGSNTDGTCKKCANYKDGCNFEDSIFKPCPIWLSFPGCPSFKKRGRKLPSVIDGELVAITSDMEVFKLQENINNKKKEIKEQMEEREKESLEVIDSFEKRRLISKGLFADSGRRSLFNEAIRG